MHHKIVAQLKRNGAVFKELLQGLSKEEYLWKPEENKWCLLEIICHLHDEEREDFRARARHILESPNDPLTKIDPEEWVRSRNYLDKDYEETLVKFTVERAASIVWLESLSETDSSWNNIYIHPQIDLTPKMIISNWVAHDFLHIRQVLKLKFQYLKQDTKEDLGYAGEW